MVKTFKKITALFLAMLLVFGLFSVVPVVAASSTQNCTVLVPEEAAEHTCKSNWEDRISKLNVASKYPSTTVQVGDHNKADLTEPPCVKENMVQTATLNYKKNSGDATYTAAESLTNNKIYTIDDKTEPAVAIGYLDPDASVIGTDRVTRDIYDFTVVMDLGKQTSIDKIYSFSSASVVNAWAIYKIYVSDTQEDLWDEENEVAYFNYFDGYAPNGTATQNYKLNGCWQDLQNPEGQIWSFTAEKPVGQFVGYKVYETGKPGNTTFSCYELGVNGVADIQTIHSELIEIEPYNCTMVLEAGKTLQFKVNAYGDANITAVKVIKDGATDVVLTAENGIYTIPALEDGMKIKVETDTDTTTPFGGIWNGVDLFKNSTAYDPKLWNSNVTYNEGVMIHKDRTTVQLLYPIKEVVSVRSYNLQTVYYPGKDYEVTADGKLKILENSDIPVYQEIEKLYERNTVYFESTQWKYQISITYTHDTTWGKNAAYETVPQYNKDALSKFIQKAKSGEQTNVVFYGDSISTGCSSTGMYDYGYNYAASTPASQLTKGYRTKASSYGLKATDLPDWVCDTWPVAVTNALKSQFGDNITYSNRAIGSTASAWGSAQENMEVLLGKADEDHPCPTPDLLFIGYGMNEWKNPKENQNTNTKKIIDYVRTLNPDCAIVLVSAFHPNVYTDATDSSTLTSYNLGEQEQGFYELAEEYEGVVVAPVYTVTASMLTVKSPIDYTHNCYNHPNDFGARIYAATILSTLRYDEKRTIYLGVGTNETERNLSWQTTSNTVGRVQYAEKSGAEFPTTYSEAVAEVSLATNNPGYYVNRATIKNLKPNTEYVYRIVNDETTKTYSFKTDALGSFNFLHSADPQLGSGGVAAGTQKWQTSMTKIRSEFPDVNLMISSGDQVAHDGSIEAEYTAYFSPEELTSFTTATTIGNHDNSIAYSEHFNNPNNNIDGVVYGATSAGGDYWFVYNNVLFIQLNTNAAVTDDIVAEHRTFMENAIVANPNVDWKIVLCHHCLYSRGPHYDDTIVLKNREALVPIFNELDIDVVLTGHDHIYTRSHMMNGFEPQNQNGVQSSVTDPEGILYITGATVTNTSAQDPEEDIPDYIAVTGPGRTTSINNIEITPTSFKITAYKLEDMSVIDEFEIKKTPPHTHSAEPVAGQSATCIEEGWKDYYMCDCGIYYADKDGKTEIPDIEAWKKGEGKITGSHKYTTYIYNNNATCLKDGTKTAQCVYGCGKGTHTITATGTKKAHSYGANYVSKKATTSKDGVISKKCACGKVVKVSTIYRGKTISVTSSVTYTGKLLKPKVTVKNSKGKPISSNYYTLKYINNKKVGKATVTVTFKGNYSGTKKLTFKILPKKTSISSLKAGKKSFTVKYKKQTSGTGYEIQYSASKKFKSAKTVKISKNKTVSKTVKKLKSKKTYYVRVRVTKGSSYKSNWSAVKKVKAK